MAAGLAPRARSGRFAQPGELREAMACNHSLLTHSRPIMEYLFDQVRHSHSVVVLADRAACSCTPWAAPALWTRPSAWR